MRDSLYIVCYWMIIALDRVAALVSIYHKHQRLHNPVLIHIQADVQLPEETHSAH